MMLATLSPILAKGKKEAASPEQNTSSTQETTDNAGKNGNNIEEKAVETPEEKIDWSKSGRHT